MLRLRLQPPLAMLLMRTAQFKPERTTGAPNSRKAGSLVRDAAKVMGKLLAPVLMGHKWAKHGVKLRPKASIAA
jgi:hypothetical protein